MGGLWTEIQSLSSGWRGAGGIWTQIKSKFSTKSINLGGGGILTEVQNLKFSIM